MKKIIYLLIVIITAFSCNKESDYLTFSGKIINKKSDSLIIFHPKRNYTKIIKLNSDGSFKDTLKVVNGLYSITNSRDFSLLYLINGDHVTMNFDANRFQESIQFTNDHTLENNFLATSVANENKFFGDTNLMFLPKEAFDAKVASYVDVFNKRINETKLDIDFEEHQKKEIINFKEYLEKEYWEKNYSKLVLGKGKPSPKFSNYENYKGGTLSLEALKGKYVYIDVWATWCPPCKVEIPYLQKIENEFHDKNIAFVSISLDDKNGYNAWKNMVKDKNLGGIQLYAKGDKSFTTAYRVKSIPRFILIDPNGDIVDSDAPRPSNPRLKILLQSLGL